MHFMDTQETVHCDFYRFAKDASVFLRLGTVRSDFASDPDYAITINAANTIHSYVTDSRTR